MSLAARLCCWILLCPALLSACGGKPDETILRLTGGSMGTTYNVQVPGSFADAEKQELQVLAQSALDEVENRMSTWIDDSELSRLNASTSTDWQPVSPALCEVLELAERVSEASGGAFDTTVGPLVDAWGFGAAPGERRVPDAATIDALRGVTGYTQLAVDCGEERVRKAIAGLQVDLSAIAKGYGVDRVAESLAGAGIDSYLVEVGGEMQGRGVKPDGSRWRIGIETPNREIRAVYDAIVLRDTALATSGDYRNFFEADGVFYSHTIDPRTGRPTTHNTAGVTVLAATTAAADAWATALLVLGSNDGLELAERENIAALFLDRGEDGIEPVASTAFRAYADATSPE